ncbi:hypothetical protein F3Y22_tig00110313pilonHSYRG00070 [Hibiscus syriacus]|uniref:RNase H type-1 domain-containing protein n=1 Tax=Hibiscus syriacus TaxID=106335 RepID=A0A6A3B549_HIBSY|nr:hypothetical protein F3Y22_tig00110313pilonHSYRG00070 [Hibiscus syriacus]
MLRILRDCRLARALWQRFTKYYNQTVFLTLSLLDWMLQNLECNSHCVESNGPWSLLFSSIIWEIRKTRNSFIFQGITATAAKILQIRIMWSKLYSCTASTGLPPAFHEPKLFQWQPPDEGTYSLNTDGAVTFGSKATAGGVLKDHCGTFILAFNKFLGCLSVLEAELSGVPEGLNLVWQYGLNVRAIASLWQKAWFIDFVQIAREANEAADNMTKHNTKENGSLWIFNSISAGFHRFIHRDIHGPLHLRIRG